MLLTLHPSSCLLSSAAFLSSAFSFFFSSLPSSSLFFSASFYPFSSCSYLPVCTPLASSLPSYLTGYLCSGPSWLLSHSDPEQPGQGPLMMLASVSIGMKAGARPGGPPGAAPGQPGADGESVLSKILPGGAAEQAGKLTEGMPCLGPGPW